MMKRNRTQLRRAALGLLLLPALTQAAGPNIVLFIGDGMGFEQVQAGRLYRTGSDSVPLTFETLPYHGQVVTRLPDGTVTDSATAATALATGYQHPVNGIISMDGGQSIKPSILELAKAKGLRTGIITTDSIDGATPAAFGAHEPDRRLVAEIRRDYLLADTRYPHPASRPNLLFGGGFDDPQPLPGVTASYVALARSLGYTFIDQAGSLADLPQADFVLGLFGSGWVPMDAAAAGNSTQPRLSAMVDKALRLLHGNGDGGFFLMVEGALIDKFSHVGNPNLAAEVAQLDLAVAAALTWAGQNGQDLLVIVTADHETGGLNVPDGQSLTPSTVPAMTFSTTGHTGAEVPVYANWPAGLQGQTIDNTEVFAIMEDYLEGGTPPRITDLVAAEITATGVILQWNTTEPSDSRAVLSEGGGSCANPARVLAHRLSCNGLAPGNTYTLRVSSKDLTGFTGTRTIDVTTPSAPEAPPRS